MNKLFKNILVPVALSIGFVACEEEVTTYDGPEFVRFTNSTVRVNESSPDEITIPIHVVGDAPSSDVTVNLTTSGSAVEGEDFEFVSSSSPTISAGEYFTDVVIRVFDNEDLDGSRQLRLVIADAADYQIGYGGDSTEFAIGEFYTVNIDDDDFWCPRNILAGFITTATDVGYSSGDAFIEPADGPGPECLTFMIMGGASPIFGAQVDFEITIEEDSEQSLTGTVLDKDNIQLMYNGAAQTAYSLEIAEGVYSGEDNYYNLETGQIGFDYIFYSGGSPAFSGRLEYCGKSTCP